ncbi:MAG TPA: CHC2 zinc finger domain-containing protein, partial [Bacteroidia bacterium]|nr:CHC2 zinc finger domain-containing protein [Bacteroidia bacterium]
MEIPEIKQKLTLAEVIKHYGFKADKQNRINCPFHQDKTPSMQLYWKTHTAYCFSGNCKTHGKSLDVIDFIMHSESSTKAEAINKAKEMITGTASPMEQLTRTAILTKMFTYFKNAVHNSKPAREYIEQRGLDFTKLEIGYNSGQFHHGTRKDETLIKNCLEVGLLQDTGLVSRTGAKAFKPFAKFCIAFALRNRAGQVTGLYFRSTVNEQESKHFYLKDRSGLYPEHPKAGTKKLIIAESIIDTATLLQLEEITEEYSLLALYGTNGLTGEHITAIKDLQQLEEIIFCLNGDKAGIEAVKKHSLALQQLKPLVKIYNIEPPQGEDINSLLQGHQPEIFTELLNKKTFIFSNEKPQENKVQLKEKTAKNTENKAEPEEKQISLDTKNPFKIRYTSQTANYYIQGGISKVLDNMKVTLVVEHLASLLKSRNKVDLYEDRQVEKLCKEVAEKLSLRKDLLEADLYKLTDLLDEFRETELLQNKEGKEQEGETIYPLTTQERGQIETLLKKPKLIQKLGEL